jgi:hypothetical protein
MRRIMPRSVSGFNSFASDARFFRFVFLLLGGLDGVSGFFAGNGGSMSKPKTGRKSPPVKTEPAAAKTAVQEALEITWVLT